MEPTTSLRTRLSRFLSDRYVQRERPNYLPEFVILGLIVIAAIWPILSLVAAMAMVR
jgi:hypothetical protein